MHKTNKCIKCQSRIKAASTYCVSCRMKYNHPNYKSGKPKCIECKKELFDYTSKRCRPCWRKYNKSKNHPNWQGGKEAYFGRFANAIYREHNINIICEQCGAINDICIHHRDEDCRNNNLKNLQPLCRGCHTKLHKKYAKKIY